MRSLPVAITAALLAGCVTGSGETPSQRADRWALENARPAGPAVNCIQTSRIRTSHVRDEQVIDFELTGGEIFRSRLPQACPGLGFEERFAYRTSIDRLCSVDIITVLHSDGSRGASCGLGPFEPVEIPRRPRG